MKKAMFFTFDALFAALIIVGTVILYTNLAASSTERVQSQAAANDILLTLGELQLKEIEIQEPWIAQLYNSNVPVDENDSVLYTLGVLWALNDSRVNNLTAVLNTSLPANMGLRLRIETTQLYDDQKKNTNTTLSVARQQITGIAQSVPLLGSSSSANLKKIRNKRTSEFIYFGGFVGQGNITVRSRVFPNNTNVTSMNLELDIPDPANLYINDNFCRNMQAETGAISVEVFDISNCSQFVNPSIENLFQINFTNTSISSAFIAGGLINIEYTTDELLGGFSLGNQRIYLPGIEGIVNLFDAFHVPGSLTSMQVYLHYLATTNGSSNNTFYMGIGNKTIFLDNTSTTVQTVTLGDANFTSLNYSQLSNGTIPFRIGFENLTFATVFSGNADIVFVTDVSGSMAWEMGYTGGSCGGCPGNSCCGVNRACDDPNLFDSDTSRLNLTVCLEKEFFTEMLNFTNNFIGLVSYEEWLDSSLALQSTYTPLDQEVAAYSPGGNTKICLGVNEALNILDLSTITHLASNSSWHYNTSYFTSTPPQDFAAREWYEVGYALENQWNQANAILGSTNADVYNPPVSTEIGNGLTGAGVFYADLWDMSGDRPEPIDFTTGLNSTANTFGAAAGDDGWDWARDLYATGTTDMTSHYDPSGLSDGVTMDGSGRIQIEVGGLSCTNCGFVDGGAFGIQFNITPAMWNMLSSNGNATVSFNYEAFDRELFYGTDETEESVWLKARFGNATTMTYLGYDLDTGYSSGTHPSDNTNEILFDYDFSTTWESDNDRGDFDMDGDGDYNGGLHVEDVTSLINGPGVYYLELGAKADFSGSNAWQVSSEGIRAYYDNVQLIISNETDNYYFRSDFNIASLNQYPRAFFNLLADDNADIYINGQLVYSQASQTQAQYYNVRGINIPNGLLNTGNNEVAVKLQNRNGAAKFDMEIVGVNDSQSQNIFVMTDGVANEECPEQGFTADLDGNGVADQGPDDAIQSACDAAQDYGVTVYAVGFSDGADVTTLQLMADCGNGLYRQSDNATELQDFFDDVAFNILIGGRQSQIVDITSGSYQESILYSDSYIDITYDPVVANPGVGDISISLQSPRFNSCTGSVNVPAGIRVADARVTSYSAEHWTDLVTKDGNKVYNLSDYSSNYEILGDPFLVDIPANLFGTGNNDVTVNIGDSPTQSFNCSLNNSLIYTVLFQAATGRSQVVDVADGCTWTVEYEDTTNTTINVPTGYAGANTCSYTSSNFTLGQGAYNPLDAYDLAVYDLLSQLDFDADGRVFVNFDANDIEIVVNSVSSIPYLWGPSIVEVDVWQ